jgi:hypothetical protein
LPETTGEGCVDRDKEYDKLAELIRSSCDIKHIYKIIEEGI